MAGDLELLEANSAVRGWASGSGGRCMSWHSAWSGLDGELVDVNERLAEIRQRYGPAHIVIDLIDDAGPELVRIVRTMEAARRSAEAAR